MNDIDSDIQKLDKIAREMAESLPEVMKLRDFLVRARTRTHTHTRRENTLRARACAAGRAKRRLTSLLVSLIDFLEDIAATPDTETPHDMGETGRVRKQKAKRSKPETEIVDALIDETEFPSTDEKPSKVPRKYVRFVRQWHEEHMRRFPTACMELTDKLESSAADTIDRLVRLDGYDFEKDVKPALLWAIEDEFWGPNCVSLAPLRKKSVRNGKTKFSNILSAYRRDGTGSVSKPRNEQIGRVQSRLTGLVQRLRPDDVKRNLGTIRQYAEEVTKFLSRHETIAEQPDRIVGRLFDYVLASRERIRRFRVDDLKPGSMLWKSFLKKEGIDT